MCICKSGYSGDGFSCTSEYIIPMGNMGIFLLQSFIDIDECSTGGVCDENAECVDTAGSYECTCSSGYTGDGHTCLDIDECLSDPCDENATCTNNNGSFSCHCHIGFVGNGKRCIRKFMLISNIVQLY